MGMEAPFLPSVSPACQIFPRWMTPVRRYPYFKRGLRGNFVFEPRGGRTKFFNRLKNCFSFSFCAGGGIIKRVDRRVVLSLRFSLLYFLVVCCCRWKTGLEIFWKILFYFETVIGKWRFLNFNFGSILLKILARRSFDIIGRSIQDWWNNVEIILKIFEM